jgi:Tfp pilus assembly protein PilO
MRQLTPREKAIVGVGAAAVVIFAYLFGLLLPARRAAASIAQQQTEVRDQLDQAERMYHDAMSAQTKIASLKKQSQDIMFPAADVQSGTVREIEKLSKELDVTVTSIRPGDPESADGSTRYPTVIRVEADLGKIVRLLYGLEQPNRRLWVEGAEITSARQTGATLQATIYVAAYKPSRESEAPNVKA